MDRLNVSELWVYPIKSCRGIAVDSLDLDDRGPRNDRRWMIVDRDGNFMTQRDTPRMALIDVHIVGDDVEVGAPGSPTLRVHADDGGRTVHCRVWADTVTAREASAEAHEWFSDFLGETVRLVAMPRESERVIDRTYSPERRLVTFADAYPMLLITQGSLDELNRRLAASGHDPVPMRRFRPNIVVTGTTGHAEDAWASITVGQVECSLVKPCARCVVPTIDIATATVGKEPTRTLARYRRRNNNVFFGENVIHAAPGTITVGDTVVVNRLRAEPPVYGGGITSHD